MCTSEGLQLLWPCCGHLGTACMVATSTVWSALCEILYLKQMARPYAASAVGAFVQVVPSTRSGWAGRRVYGRRPMTSCFVAPLWDGLAIAHVLVRLP